MLVFIEMKIVWWLFDVDSYNLFFIFEVYWDLIDCNCICNCRIFRCWCEYVNGKDFDIVGIKDK